MSRSQLAELYATGPDALASGAITPAQQIAFCEYVAERAHTVIQALGWTWRIMSDSPLGYEAVCAQVDRAKEIVVSNQYNDSKLMPGFFNLAFRAWHDAHHVVFGNDFSLSGETDNAWSQCIVGQDDSLLYAKIIFSEVVLQAAYYYEHGDFASFDQKVVLVSDAFILEFLSVGAGCLDLDYYNPTKQLVAA